jgi:uncharacterized protein involved in exopolysaccharide biosynthesis
MVEIIRSDAMTAAKGRGLIADPEFQGLWPQEDASRAKARALETIGRRLHVQRRVMTPIVEITFEHSSPARAAAIANTFAEEHVSRSTRDYAEVLAQQHSWLLQIRAQLKTLEAQAEAEADAYRATVRSGERPNMRLAELEQRTSHLRTQLEDLPAPSPVFLVWDYLGFKPLDWRAAMISRAETPRSPSSR